MSEKDISLSGEARIICLLGIKMLELTKSDQPQQTFLYNLGIVKGIAQAAQIMKIDTSIFNSSLNLLSGGHECYDQTTIY